MKLLGIEFFNRTSDPYRLSIASYHSPHSLTWRWGLSVTFPRAKDIGRWIGFHSYRHNYGSETNIQFARVCLTLSTQKPMWYRDLYMQLRDEADERGSALYRPKPVPPVRNVVESPGAVQ